MLRHAHVWAMRVFLSLLLVLLRRRLDLVEQIVFRYDESMWMFYTPPWKKSRDTHTHTSLLLCRHIYWEKYVFTFILVDFRERKNTRENYYDRCRRWFDQWIDLLSSFGESSTLFAKVNTRLRIYCFKWTQCQTSRWRWSKEWKNSLLDHFSSNKSMIDEIISMLREREREKKSQYDNARGGQRRKNLSYFLAED